MKFFATILILCAISGFAVQSVLTSSYSSTTTSAPDYDGTYSIVEDISSTTATPCGDGPIGPCGQALLPFLRGYRGKKVYFFYK